MNEKLSEKISIISFITIIMVVIIHSANISTHTILTNGFNYSYYNWYIQNIIAEGVARSAVPLFFAISGYLFFINIKSFNIITFIKKLETRFFSLFIPYVLWCLIAYFFVFLLIKMKLFTAINIVNPNIYSNYNIDRSFYNLLYYINLKPIPFQFWFLRELMAYILVTPLIYILTKRLGYITIIPSVMMYLYIIKPINISFSPDGLLYFPLGCILAIKQVDVNIKLTNIKRRIITIGWILILIAATHIRYILLSSGADMTTQVGKVYIYFQRIEVLLGAISIWINYESYFKYIIPKIKKWKLTQYTFFIYCFHEPLQSCIKGALFNQFGFANNISLILFFIAPVISIFICILTAELLSKYVNGFYKILIGNR